MRAMRTVFATSIVMVLGTLPDATVTHAHPPAKLTADQEKGTIEEVKAFRRSLAVAIVAKNAAALRAMYSDGFQHAHGSGKLDGREARIVAALAGDPVIETAPVSGLEIRVPGGWTAIATGLSPIKSLADGKTSMFRWIAVYVRMGDGWQLAASQATGVAEVQP